MYDLSYACTLSRTHTTNISMYIRVEHNFFFKFQNVIVPESCDYIWEVMCENVSKFVIDLDLPPPLQS